MKVFKGWMLFIGANGAAIVLLYLAIVEHMKSAENLVVFLIWVTTALTLMAMIAVAGDDKALENAKAKATSASKYKIPEWAHAAVNVAILCIIAASGWYWTASAYFVQAVLHSAIRPKLYGSGVKS